MRDLRGPSLEAAFDPAMPGVPARVVKGGSYLHVPDYHQRYRRAARTGRDLSFGASDVGFCLAYDHPPARG